MRSKIWQGLVVLGVVAVLGGVAVGIDPPLPNESPSLPVPFNAVIPVSHDDPAPAAVPRPEAAVSLEWSGPPTIKVNQPAVYSLTVRNTSLQFVQKVVVQIKAAKQATVKETSPTAKIVEGVYLWELGTLEPKESRDLKLTITQSTKGELGCQAWVTFTGTAGMKVQVREPELQAELNVPPSVMLGDPILVKTRIRNSGNCDVGVIRYELKSTPGFERIGVEQNLTVGAAKSVDFQDEAKSPGVVEYQLLAIGDDVARVVAKASVKVLQPQLQVTVDGPSEVMLNRKGSYTFRVKNTGDVPIYGTELNWEVPAYLMPGNTGRGLENLDKLEVGQTKEFPVEFQLSKAGPVVINATAWGFKTPRTALANANTADVKVSTRTVTQVQGIPALRMEMVDTLDPVQRGSETTYEIRITNTGSKSDTNIVIRCPIPQQLQLVSCTGPVGYSVEQLNNIALIKFEPVRELAPRTEAVFRVKVKAIKNGDIRFTAMLNSSHLSTSVVKEESTRVYGE